MTNSNQEIIISAYVLAKILAVDSLDHSKESAGLLLGYVDDDGETLVITDFDTGKQQQTSTYVVMDDEALVQIATDLLKRDKKETIVGWAHTHPSYGCFLSGTDKSTQRTYQSLFSKAVALVVDPSKYYNSSDQKDLEIKFFRMIDDVDYKAVPFGIFYDDVTTHLANLVEFDIKWELPTLLPDEVKILHQKIQSIKPSSMLEGDKQLLHGFVDVLSTSSEEFVSSNEGKETLEAIDMKLNHIIRDVNYIYGEETSNLYAVLNVIAVIIITISWLLAAFIA
ncbi:MAG: hypothetical protein GOP50_06405 [Candidatus Heimdallarchaeota archaeon]|nr:hypothetical protein [Candidatus Heimdallarchaeota archaeon]